MDFIERLTGLELDGGSGAIEWMFVVAPALVALALVICIRRRVRSR